jgi:glyoxylase-like metal-dependent hydrolase (beta-lactamase superfamily II)
MTLDGTNTWVLVAAGHPAAVVVDPGPADPTHLQAIRDAAREAGAETVGLIVLTHGHSDHAEGAPAFARATGAPIRAADPALCADAEPLVDGERLTFGALALEVVATPGHTWDSICLLMTDGQSGPATLTGDTILGRGSTVVAHPDGRLGDYLGSLHRLRSLVDERRVVAVLPGHGPVRDDAVALVDGYLAHREERLDQVRAAITAGAPDADAVLRQVYGEVDGGLIFAARWSLEAQLDYLREQGEPVRLGRAT